MTKWSPLLWWIFLVYYSNSQTGKKSEVANHLPVHKSQDNPKECAWGSKYIHPSNKAVSAFKGGKADFHFTLTNTCITIIHYLTIKMSWVGFLRHINFKAKTDLYKKQYYTGKHLGSISSILFTLSRTLQTWTVCHFLLEDHWAHFLDWNQREYKVIFLSI